VQAPPPRQEARRRRQEALQEAQAVALTVDPKIEQLTIGAAADAWRDAGFAADGHETAAGSVRLRLGGGEGGIEAWLLRDCDATDFDGLPTAMAKPGESLPPPTAVTHPNGTLQIDHIVVFTDDLERTTAAFEAAGIERRRVREVEIEGGMLRQGFFRLVEVIAEVVQHAKVEPGPARFWGITFTVADLDAAADLLGERLGTIRDAVQPGRRIATLRSGTGLGLPVALITPEPPKS
jgi:hypothetical protein